MLAYVGHGVKPLGVRGTGGVGLRKGKNTTDVSNHHHNNNLNFADIQFRNV
jgi:hypothetical protein